MALAWDLEQSSKCPGCGLYLDETLNHEHAREWVAEGVRCDACAASEREAKAFTRASGGMAAGDPSGMSFPVHRETR